jgi:hypothetical protein
MRALKTIALFGLSLIVALVLIDAYLQLAGIQTPMETRIDPELGPSYIPNKWITRFNEGFFMGAVNAYGYMGPGRPPRRVGREKRILLLGDSFVLGHTVLPRQYFGHYLEDRLRASTGRDVQALNFGKADFNVGNMYQYFHDFAGTFDHDLALFFVGEGDLVPASQVASNLYPTVRWNGTDIVIDKGFRKTTAFRFYKKIEPFLVRSSVLRLAFNSYKVVESGGWRTVVFDKAARVIRLPRPAKTASGSGPDPLGLSEVNRAILRKLAEDPRNVLVIDTPLDARIRKDVDEIGIPIIDLGTFLEDLRKKGLDPYYWPVTGMRGHWNHASQPLIGEFLADQIAKRGLL